MTWPRIHTTDLIAGARRFATEARQRIDQRRTYTNQPYIVTDDWPQIARLAPHIEQRLRRHGG